MATAPARGEVAGAVVIDIAPEWDQIETGLWCDTCLLSPRRAGSR